MRAACIQICSGIDPAANLEMASTYIREAAADGATLIATPEMTGLLQRRPNLFWQAVKAQEEDPLIPAFASLAKELGVTLLIGSLAVKTGEKRAANRSFLFGPDGQLITSYDKVHMFDVDLGRGEKWKESAIYDGGDKAVLADIKDTKLGLTICYDVRFPPLYKTLAMAGADMIAAPAAFTVPTGKAHWEVLLRARAIETGSFILAPAQCGAHEDGRSTWGHSMIIGPWGDIRAQMQDGIGFIAADIDMADVRQARRKIPAWNIQADYAL